jgi:cytidylate kinase
LFPPSPDACVVDSTELNIDEVVEVVLEKLRRRQLMPDE